MKSLKRTLTFLIISLSTLSSIQARDWAKIPIPNAYCGDGAPYFVFLDRRSDHKWAFEFMEGGACWSTSTCWGPNLRTWIHPIPELPQFSILTTETSPLKDHSMVYFPYCTGDVFSGTHKASYFGGAKVRHVGSTNIQKTIKYLAKIKLLKKKELKDLVLYGASAGAIGSLLHTRTFEKFLGIDSKHVRKRLLSDSPGLHFGHDFWEKFTQEQIDDFSKAFSDVDMNITFDDGLVAPNVREFCDANPQWQVSFLQATLDPIMSVLFGGISPAEHRKKVLSPLGIIAQLDGSENCKVWSIDKPYHALIALPFAADKADGLSRNETARDFIFRFLQ